EPRLAPRAILPHPTAGARALPARRASWRGAPAGVEPEACGLQVGVSRPRGRVRAAHHRRPAGRMRPGRAESSRRPAGRGDAHGGVIPYGSTFLIFSDYMRPALRLSTLMELGTIWVYTHDSIGLGEDGPTHQPVEHYAALRAIPGLLFIRPCDAAETAWAWRVAIANRHRPTALALTRQNVPTLDRTAYAPADGLVRGAYVLNPGVSRFDVVLIATGSEVQHIVAAEQLLARHGVQARLVSMPCWELFDE